MNSEVIKSEEEKQEIKFPCLMKHKPSSFYILATGYSEDKNSFKGFVVVGDSYTPIGSYSEKWVESLFTPTKDIIQLSNE